MSGEQATQLALLEDWDPEETAREQRKILRTLRKNYPHGENRLVLEDGQHAIYQQMKAGNGKRPRRFNLYQLPCSEEMCYLEGLCHCMINPWGTLALWKTEDTERDGTRDPCNHCGQYCGHVCPDDL